MIRVSVALLVSFPRSMFPHFTPPAQTPEFPPQVIRVNAELAVNWWPWQGDPAPVVWHVCKRSSSLTSPFVMTTADPR